MELSLAIFLSEGQQYNPRLLYSILAPWTECCSPTQIIEKGHVRRGIRLKNRCQMKYVDYLLRRRAQPKVSVHEKGCDLIYRKSWQEVE